MDRQPSYMSDQTYSRRPHPVLPPWEVRKIPQVPFIEPGSPPPSQPTVQRDAQRFLSHSRPSAQSGHRPKLSTTASAPSGLEYGSPISEDPSSLPWKAARATPPPYETQTNDPDPAATKSAPSIPPWPIQAPPTPPDSVSKSPPRSLSSSPPVKRVTKALPGTMSSRAAREKEGTRTRAKSHTREGRSNRSHSQPLPREEPQRPFGKRFKSAFKEIFRRDPVDESQFERIGERHWTDDI